MSGAAPRPSRGRSASQAWSCQDPAGRRTMRVPAAHRASSPRPWRCADSPRRRAAPRTLRTIAGEASRRRARLRGCRAARRRAPRHRAEGRLHPRAAVSAPRSYGCSLLSAVDLRQQALGVTKLRHCFHGLLDHALRFRLLVLQLQEHSQRLLHEIGRRWLHRDGLGLLNQQEARNLPLQLGDDVLRLLLADTRKRAQKCVVALVDGARDAMYRSAEGPAGGFRADACHRQERLEEFALDGVGETEKDEATGVAVRLELTINLQRDGTPLAAAQLLADARRKQDLIEEARDLDERPFVASLRERTRDP